MFAIAYGGVIYASVVWVLLALAAWEYTQLFRAAGLRPASIFVVGGSLALLVDRYLAGLEASAGLLSLLVLASMTYHLLSYERGRDQAATDFAITLAGILYFGWIGGYMLALRELPEGKWWVLLVLPVVWLADTGAYFFGSRFGRHPFSPRLSPRKTWEGYWGGVLSGVLGAILVTAIWRIGAGPDSALTYPRSALIGLVISALTPLGDLGESMIKRQVGAKDSSQLIPGHGGFFDRIDSWLWAAVIGYYLITAAG
jgi:phosphatidate cytidylyltransferase